LNPKLPALAFFEKLQDTLESSPRLRRLAGASWQSMAGCHPPCIIWIRWEAAGVGGNPQLGMNILNISIG